MNLSRSPFSYLVLTGSLIWPNGAGAQGGLDAAAPIAPYLNGALPSRLSGPSSGTWAFEEAFPSLRFTDPVQILPVPSSSRLLVVEKPGRLAGGDPAIRAFFYPSASLDGEGRRPRAFQPDQWIGTNRKRSKGDTIYNLSARDQSLETRVPPEGVARFHITLQNDRNVAESPSLRSSPLFRGEKRVSLVAGKNVTAALVSGRLQGRLLQPGEVTGLRISSLGSRATDSMRPREIHFTASSTRPGIGKDRGRAVLESIRKRGR